MSRSQSHPNVLTPHVLDFISHSPTQTLRIGQRLGEYLQAGDLILLSGDLGVGKTQLVKGIVQGLGSPDLVTSPSFVLVNQYTPDPRWSRMQIHHADLYRLADPSEILNIGLDELWNQQDICLIEWAERAGAHLPDTHLSIAMRYLDETKRVLRFTPHGRRYEQLVDAFKVAAFG